MKLCLIGSQCRSKQINISFLTIALLTHLEANISIQKDITANVVNIKMPAAV